MQNRVQCGAHPQAQAIAMPAPRYDDRVYQLMTVAAIVTVLVSVWVF